MGKASKRKRVVVWGDRHHGHAFALTPPDFQMKTVGSPSSSLIRRQNKCAAFQEEMWNWISKEIESLKPVDVLLDLGDCIDGSGQKTGGSEQVHSDKNVQVQMAIETMKMVGANDVVMVYGSKYHVADADGSSDYEDQIAQAMGIRKIGAHEWVDVNSLVFDMHHKVGRSSIPHSRGTSIARAWLWSALWSEMKMAPRADIILRAHVHYPFFVGDPLVPYLALTVPALQWSTKFGSRECEGTVGCGFVHFDVEENGEYTYKFHIARLPEQKTTAIKL
jgi:hypothetical protein